MSEFSMKRIHFGSLCIFFVANHYNSYISQKTHAVYIKACDCFTAIVNNKQ